jgi:hypothetical protein
MLIINYIYVLYNILNYIILNEIFYIKVIE